MAASKRIMEVPGDMENGLDDRLPNFRQIVQLLCRIVPRCAGAVVAMVDVRTRPVGYPRAGTQPRHRSLTNSRLDSQTYVLR
jgi:hypothetical protein